MLSCSRSPGCKSTVLSKGASTLDTMLLHVPRVCTSFMLFIFVMQLYWFGLMVRGAAKMLKGKSGKTNRKADKSS